MQRERGGHQDATSDGAVVTAATVPERIAGHPVGNTDNRLYFADSSVIYAGRYLHDGFFPTHTHSFLEIALPIAGRGVHHTVAGRQELTAGDVVLMRPGLWHGYEDCVGLEVFNCCVSTDVLRHELGWTRDDPLLGPSLWTRPQGGATLGVRLGADAFAACVEHLEALEQLAGKAVRRHRAAMLGRLMLVLCELGRVAQEARADENSDEPVHPAVARAMQLLEADLGRAWTLVELAEELHLAPNYLVRLFGSATGQPPMTYLARLRLETAATMLLETGRSINQIAADTGWSDQNYFARRFKVHFGLSATAYRARFRDHAHAGKSTQC